MRKTKTGHLLLALLSLALAACAAELDEGEIEGDLDEEELDELEAIATPNLVKNAGFESAFCPSCTDWKAHLAYRTTSFPHGGSYALYAPAGSFATQMVRLTPDRDYLVAAWTRHKSGSDSQTMHLGVVDADGALIYDRRFSAGPGASWHTVSASFYAPPSARELWIVLEDLTGGPSTAYWDDVSVRGYY